VKRSTVLLAVSLVLEVSEGRTAPTDTVQRAGPVRVDPQNPHYFNCRGRPLVLVNSDYTCFAVHAADYDYVRFIDALAANGNNFEFWKDRLNAHRPQRHPGPRSVASIVREESSRAPGQFLAA